MGETYTEPVDVGSAQGFLATTTYGRCGLAGQGVGIVEVDDIVVEKSPFSMKGEALQISSREMEVGRPYPCEFMGWWFVAVRREDDQLYFYYLGE